MKVLNLDNRDYHMHSSTFSDGLSTIDEIVRFAGEIGMTEIAITDHSKAIADFYSNKFGFYTSGARCIIKRWENIHNDVNVIFGVEGDLLNEDGDVCFHIQGIESEFLILSAHKAAYKGSPESITDAMVKAIVNNYEKIKFIAHPCSIPNFGNEIDIERLISVANEYNIPLEFNATYFVAGKTHLEKLDYLLKNANEIYVNSDGHTFHEIKENRKKAIEFLRENGYI